MDPYSLGLLVAALLAVSFAAWTDLKTREVPDFVPIGLVVISLMVHVFHAWDSQELFFILIPILVGLFTFMVGYGFWLLGVWAGGDVKLFAALGVALPFTLAPFAVFPPLTGTFFLPLFPLTLFLYAILMGLPAALFLLIKAFFQNKELRQAIHHEIKSCGPLWILLSIFSVLSSQLLLAFKQDLLWLVPLVIVFSFLSRRIQIMSTGAFLVGGVLTGLNGLAAAQLALTGFIILAFFSLLLHTPVWCNRFVFRKKVPISDLKVGDISAQTLVIQSKKIVEWHAPSLKEIFNKPQSVLLLPKDPKISAFRAAGLEKSDITWLKKCVLEKKWPPYLWVKQSIPFVPLVWLGLILSLFVGDLLLNLLFI